MRSRDRDSHTDRSTILICMVVVIVASLLLPSIPLSTSTSIGPTGDGGGDSLSSMGPQNTNPPIVIANDTDLADQAAANMWPGDGTAGDPYIISGYHINGSEARFCIHVTDVSAHLVISDNHLVNASIKRTDPDYPTESGIMVERCGNVTIRDNLIENITKYYHYGGIGIRVTESNARIENNTVDNVQDGISISYSHVEVVGNTVLDTSHDGIVIGRETTGFAEWNMINRSEYGWYYARRGLHAASDLPFLYTNNTIRNYVHGINEDGLHQTLRDNRVVGGQNGMIVNGGNGTFINNTLKADRKGLHLGRAINATYRDNTLVGCEVDVYDSNWDDIFGHDLDETNTIEGYPILIWTRVEDQEVPKGKGQVILAYCNNITMRGEEDSRPWGGIVAGYTPDLTVTDVNISSTFGSDIRVYRSPNYLVGKCSFVNITLQSYAEDRILNLTCNGTFRDNLLVNGFIRTWYLANTRITGNTVRSDYFRGIDAHGVKDAVIEDNDVTILHPESGSSGIHIETTGTTRVYGNTLHVNGFELWGNETQMRAYDFGDDNTLGGRPVAYRKDIDSLTLENEYSQIILVGCDDFTIEGFIASTGNIGVIVAFSRGGTISNCTFYGPTYTSIHSWECDRMSVIGCSFTEGHLSIRSDDDGNLTITNNRFTGTEYHTIAAHNGDNILIEGNIILDCRWRGIYLVTDTEGSRIISNYIANNTEHAIQASGPIDIWYNTFVDNAINSSYGEGQISGGATWDDGSRGNYWSDYRERYPFATNNGVTWDTPYAPTGPRGMMDNHPLVHGWDIFPPVARAENVTVIEGQPFQLNGSLSTDNIGIVEYTWTFTTPEGPQVLMGKRVVHTIHVPGTYNVVLRVEDAEGMTDSVIFTVTVLENQAPVAVAGRNVTVNENTRVIFNGNRSTDDLGILEWNWSFEYDGGTVYLSGEVVDFTFVIPGKYTVTLRVTDPMGETGFDQLVVTVIDLDTKAPVFLPAERVTFTSEELKVVFNHSLWTDDDPDFPLGANFTWILEVDDRVLMGYGDNATIVVPRDGDMHLTASAVDAGGNIGRGEVNITLLWRPTDVEPPKARAGEDIEVHPGTPVTLMGSHVLGDLVLDGYEWRTPPGITVESDGLELNWTPATLGDFEFTFSVWDWMGNEDSDTIVVHVVPRTPTVSMTTDLGQTLVQDIVVQGTASGDADIQRVEYRIDGGEWERADGTTVWSFFLSVADLENGNHTLEVWVWDGYNHGELGLVTFEVERSPEPPDNGGGDDDGASWWLYVAVGIIVVVLVVLVVVFLRPRTEDH